MMTTQETVKKNWQFIWVCMFIAGVVSPDIALAAGMEIGWDNALCSFSNALTGKTAIAIGSIAFAAAGAGAVWGEQMTGIMKTMTNTVVGVGLLLGGTTVVNGVASAMGKGGIGC